MSCRFCAWQGVRAEAAAEPVVEPAAVRPVHGVTVYDDDEQLLRRLVDHLVEGWAQGGAGLVVATAPHREALRRRLMRLGLGACCRDGRLVELDAAETLALFMRGSSPDPQRFGETVGVLARQHAAELPLHVFGEMVDLLWADGNAVGALELESLWNGLQQTTRFSLLCGYAAPHVDATGLVALHDAHDHVVA